MHKGEEIGQLLAYRVERHFLEFKTKTLHPHAGEFAMSPRNKELILDHIAQLELKADNARLRRECTGFVSIPGSAGP